MLRRVGLMTQDDSSKRPWLVTGGAWIQGTLNSITNLAVFLKDKGQLDEAEPLFQECLIGAERCLGTYTHFHDEVGLTASRNGSTG